MGNEQFIASDNRLSRGKIKIVSNLNVSMEKLFNVLMLKYLAYLI
jgi:hypothetical protein